MSEKSRILVVAAHPDDEVLGCGGTIARMAAEGHDVFIAILGEGFTSRPAGRSEGDAGSVDLLQEQSRQAAKLLGAREVVFSSLPDNRFDTVPLLDIVKIIEGNIEKFRPDTIFTHHGGDLNIDHTVLHRAVLTATRPVAKDQPVKSIYAFEVPSSTEWAFGQLAPGFRANHFVDIGATLEIKIKAMEIYAGEVRPFPHPRSLQALRVAAQCRGSIVGLEYSEAFEVIRQIA